MIVKIFRIIILILTINQIQESVYSQVINSTYDKFVDSTKVWFISEHPDYCRSCILNHSIKFEKDTVINSIHYFTIIDYSRDSTINKVLKRGYIRETTNKKVYWLTGFFGKQSFEILLYDFDANVNEHFDKWIVTQVDSIIIMDIQRKRIHLVNSCLDQSKIWIEGIGDLSDLLNYQCQPKCDEKTGTIGITEGCSGFVQTCVTKNGELIFQNPNYINCWNYNYSNPQKTNNR